jgi:hypothetical protein
MMKGRVRELALVPHTGGGPLSRLVAAAAARLRVVEAPGVRPPHGVEGALATAQRMLADGHLAEVSECERHEGVWLPTQLCAGALSWLAR